MFFVHLFFAMLFAFFLGIQCSVIVIGIKDLNALSFEPWHSLGMLFAAIMSACFVIYAR